MSSKKYICIATNSIHCSMNNKDLLKQTKTLGGGVNIEQLPWKARFMVDTHTPPYNISSYSFI